MTKSKCLMTNGGGGLIQRRETQKRREDAGLG